MQYEQTCPRLHLLPWSLFITRPRVNGSESRFRDRYFLVFCVELCHILWSVLLHHWICIAPLEINCTIGVVLCHCFSILFEFQVIRKGCIFTRSRIPNRRRLGTSKPLELYCTIGDYFFSIRFEFQVIRKCCEGSGVDS